MPICGSAALYARQYLGILYQRQGRYAEAEATFNKLLKTRRRVIGDAHSSDYRLAGFGSIAWLAGVTKQLTPNFSAQIAAERSYRRAGLRSGGIGIDADNYIWTLYLVTLQARF